MASPTLTTEAARLLPVANDPRLERAQSLAAAGDQDGALAVYREVQASQAELFWGDALLYEQRGDIPNTVALLQRAVEADPGKPFMWLKLISLLIQQGQWWQAEQACGQVLALEPGSSVAHVYRAKALMMLGKRVEAAVEFEHALASEGSNYELVWALAQLVWNIGDFGKAEVYLRRCIELNPARIEPYAALLDLLNRADQLPAAEQLCRDYLAYNPNEPSMLQGLASVMVRQQRWADAEQVYSQLLQIAPGSLAARLSCGDMLAKIGREADVMALHRANVAAWPQLPEVHMRLGEYFELHDDKAAAATCYETARQVLANHAQGGFAVVPQPLETRFVFNQLEEIGERLCTGSRSVIDNTGLDLSQANPRLGEVVELFCIVVGKEHREYLENVAFPALYRTDGFADLQRQRRVVYNIYTVPAELDGLRPFLRRLDEAGLRYRVNVELLALSPHLYTVLCLPILDQVKRALALRSAVVMALPDAIFAGPIGRVLDGMQPDEYVVCAMPRIDSVAAYPLLAERLRASEQGLESRQLVRDSMTTFLHPQTYSAMVSENTCLRYREQGGRYLAQNFAPPPLCFYARPKMVDIMTKRPLCGPHSLASFFTVDHDFVDSAYRDGCLKVIDDSRTFFWAEFTHPGRHTSFLAGRESEDWYYPESAAYLFSRESRWVFDDSEGEAKPRKKRPQRSQTRKMLAHS